MSKSRQPQTINRVYAPLRQLGDMAVETFLKTYWQKKPLLIRQAFPDFQTPIGANELAGFALEDDVLSRLITEIKTPQGSSWHLFPENPEQDAENYAEQQ